MGVKTSLVILIHRLASPQKSSHSCQVNITPLTVILNSLNEIFNFDLLSKYHISSKIKRNHFYLSDFHKEEVKTYKKTEKNVTFIDIQTYESDTRRSLIQ